jgi:predicted metal-dependent peptidase
MKTKLPKVNDIRSNSDLTPYINALLLNEQFFGHIFRHVNFSPDEKIPTAGVAVSDGDFHMYWSPEFLSSLSNKQLFGLLKHEAFHLIFQHCTTRRLTPHAVANLAADLAINCGIPSDELPVGGFVPGEHHVNLDGSKDTSATAKLVATFPRDMSQEWYFSKLMEDQDAVKEMTAESTVVTEGFDSHDGWGDGGDKNNEALVKGKIEKILKDSIDTADRTNGWGSIGSEMRSKLRELVSSEVDWKALLRQFVRASRQGSSTSTWTNIHMSSLHENFGPANPGRKRSYISNINVYFDHSGSMSNRWIELLFAELRNFASRTDFDCFVFDTAVNEKSKIRYKGRRMPELHGVRQNCGGTCFKAPTEHASKQKNLDGYIILTDGGAAKPPKSRIKRCYVLAPGQKLAFEPDPEDTVVRMKSADKE